MARGTEIIVSSPPRGLFREGTITGTPRPGTIVQIDPDATSEIGGVTSGTNNWTYELFNVAGDGDRPVGPLFILLPDAALGTWEANTGSVLTGDVPKVLSSGTLYPGWHSAYTTGDHCFVYTPMPGEEFNMIIENQAGTGDDIAIGDPLMIDDGTGKLIAETGEEITPFMALETLTDPTADELIWVIYSGY